jgi:hypothetical protein
MASWIKRTRVGNRTYTQNLSKGGIRTTFTHKKNKSSSGPTVSLSTSTNGKSYRTETYSNNGVTKRTRTTQFKQPKVKKAPRPKSVRVKKYRPTKINLPRFGSYGDVDPRISATFYVIALIVFLIAIFAW